MSENCHEYDDIIDAERPIFTNRKAMPIRDRAAQFSSFAALSGYSDAVNEEERLTEKKREPDDERALRINDRLRSVIEHIDDDLEIKLTYFEADKRKSGGAYLVHTGVVRSFNEYERKLIFKDGKIISIDDIYEIEGKYFENM